MKKVFVVLLLTMFMLLGAEVKSWTSYESERTEINRGLDLTDSFRLFLADGLLIDGTLAITTPAEDFKTSSIASYTIGGITYTKSAIDSMSFTTADSLNADADSTEYWGIFLVQVNASGTVSTLEPSTNQTYADSLSAISALPSPTASNVRLGYILIQNSSGNTWIANTNDMTADSDCKQSFFVDYPVEVFPSGK